MNTTKSGFCARHEHFEAEILVHLDAAWNFARWLTGDRELAEDAVQEALVRCWRQLPHLRDVERFDAWLYRILMRTVADEQGRRRRHQATVQTIRLEPAVADGARDLADRDQLEGAFRHLSVDHRAVVVLHHHYGYPLTEIAGILGIPVGTARSRLLYAVRQLRSVLDASDRTLATSQERPA